MSRELVEQYEKGASKLALALRGLTREDMLCAPPADAGVGKWSIQQVAMHLADSELVFADRMKRVIAEDNPTLVGFDENKWAAHLHYEDQDANEAAQLVESARRMMANVLRKLPEGAFARRGTHTQAGPQTLAQLVQKAVNHLDHHVKFIHDKRAYWGKELW